MPKKTAGARGGASRNRPKAQKSVQLVRPNVATASEKDIPQEESSVEEETTLAAPTATPKAVSASTATASKTATVTGKKSDAEGRTAQPAKAIEEKETTPAVARGSAAARLAARRQGQVAHKPSTARPTGLVTAEHYAYVRRDLIYILILAVIMFSTIIILHFVPAIGG